MKRFVLALFAANLFFSCDVDVEECVEVPEVAEVSIVIEQLQDTLVNLKSKAELVALFSREPAVRDHVFRRSEYPDDSVFIKEIYARLTNPHLDTLLMESRRVFGDLTALESEFKAAFSNLKYYYPDTTGTFFTNLKCNWPLAKVFFFCSVACRIQNLAFYKSGPDEVLVPTCTAHFRWRIGDQHAVWYAG